MRMITEGGHDRDSMPGSIIFKLGARHNRSPPVDMPQSEIAERVLEAHVAFEVASWRGAAGRRRWTEWLDSVWEWAATTRLDEVVDVDTLRQAGKRLALDLDLPDELAGTIGAIADELVRLDVNRNTSVGDVIDRSLFEEGVSLAIDLESLRVRLIRQLLKSPVYTALASDVLYQGIKDYVFADSGAIRSIPGVSRLVKGSSAAVSRRMPGLEARVESRVKAYIENNTARTLASTEAYLLNSLDAERIRSLADEIWAALAHKPLSVADAVDPDETQRLIDYGVKVWRSLRNTDYIATVIDEGVRAYVARHGADTLAELLAQVGVDRDVLAAEAEQLAPDIVAGLAETGLLETLVRRQLAPFYQSDVFAAAIDDRR